MVQWEKLASKMAIEKTIDALKKNGIEAEFVTTGKQAKQRTLDLIPHGAEVMTMTSMTLEALGINEAINDSGLYDSVRKKLQQMDRDSQGPEMQKLGAAPEWTIGSVHAVTEDGNVLIASNSGSQLPAYAYGSTQVIWIVGTHKIVKSLEEGLKRIYEHSLPLEDKRAQKAYGIHSNVSKVLIMNREPKPERITLIFVNEPLGY